MKTLSNDFLSNSLIGLDRSALAAVTVLALAVRFHEITLPAIWYDEAFSVLLARHEPWQIWSITARDVHPPLYYLVLHYWMMMFGDGAMEVRSLSVIADVGTVLLSIKLMSLVATRRATWMAALLLALLPISIRYSQEARMYSLLGFWLMGATVALVCWVKEPEKKRFQIIYVLLMTAAFYTHYFAALYVLVHWCYWWSGRAGADTALPMLPWLLANAVIVVLYVPWLPHFIDHLSAGGVWLSPVTGEAVLSLVWQFTAMNAWGTQSLLLRAVPLMIVVACAVILIWKENRLHRISGLVVGCFFIPTVFLAMATLVVPVFAPRYLTFAAVGIPLIVAVALDISIRRTAILVLIVMIAVAVEVQGLQSVYRLTDGLDGTELRKSYRLDVLAATVKKEARPNDEIVFESLIWYLPFIYYNETGVWPKFYIDTSLGIFFNVADRGGYALLPEGNRLNYFTNLHVLECSTGNVWWIGPKTATVFRTLLENDWKQTLTFVEGEMVASLYTLKTSSLPEEGGHKASITQPPPPAAQNCPPAPFATSANRTGR
ncbi:glycosyltransferase family 39 protein [Pseudomonas thivervalensis]|uniref:glycosyltransferase family 39 protein n=1 Tax=Pseudomonas thivervalensis TaxID=86265 RepID=UPI0020966750|nr:glycosyltransferase family 39 protein [Pseudomonas thivervalensis]